MEREIFEFLDPVSMKKHIKTYTKLFTCAQI